jgi:hypothetical protein
MFKDNKTKKVRLLPLCYRCGQQVVHLVVLSMLAAATFGCVAAYGEESNLGWRPD